MMVVKLKKGMKILGTCLWLLAGVFLCGKIEVYGEEGRLTEEEVKRQVVEIVEEDREGEVTRFTIVEYDIEKLYQIIYVDLIINAYIDGLSFKELIERKQNEYAEQVGEYVHWILPYENMKQEKCKALFCECNGKIKLDTRELGVATSTDMKVYNEKCAGINLNNIKDVFYIELLLYDFDIVYIMLNEGEEYIIPFLQNNMNKSSKIIHGKIYEIDDFFVHMYNYYDEPTEGEIKEIGEVGLYGDIAALIVRKNILGYKSIEDIRLVGKLKDMFLAILFIAFFIVVVGKKIKKKK